MSMRRTESYAGAIIGLMVVILIAVMVGAMEGAGAVPPDNYEWRPPTNLNEEDDNHFTSSLLEDQKTGQLYLYYIAYPNGTRSSDDAESRLALFDEVNMTFTDVMEVPFVDHRDAMMYDGHLYRLLFSSFTGNVSILLDDDETPVYLFSYSTENQGIFDCRLLDIVNESIRVVIVMTYQIWYPSYWASFQVDYIEIPTDTFLPEITTVLNIDHRLYDNLEILYKEGIAYVLWQPENYYDTWVYCYQYDPDTGQGTGPTRIHENTQYTSGDWWYTQVDFDGNLHLLLAGQGPLMLKYSPEGEKLAEIDLSDELEELAYPYYGMYPIIVNRTGYVHLFYYHAYNTYIRVMVLDTDYGPSYRKEDMMNGDFDRTSFAVALNRTDRIISVWTLEEFELKKLWYSCQTPLAPDLDVDPSTFSFTEATMTNDETLSFSVRNRGRSVATSFMVTVTWTRPQDDLLGFIGTNDITEALEPEDSTFLEFDTDLAGGNYLVKIQIALVKPFENRVVNNEFEAWISVKDKTPELSVLWPHDGMEVDDILYFEGNTSDREDPDDVTTRIMGPGNFQHIITGSGPWNLTINTSEVTSGTYGLLFIASDGSSERQIARLIFVDHPEETLTYDVIDPEHDVELIVGEGQAFRFEADDLFQRRIHYMWAIDDSIVAESVSSFLYIATTAGEYVLRVEATNGRHTVHYEWTISVRDPIPPSIVAVRPDDDQDALKGDTIEFEVEIQNPDDRPCSVTWTRNQVLVEGEGDSVRSMTFLASGVHRVMVTLFSVDGASIVEWTITVVNRAPVLGTPVPEAGTMTITEAADTTFKLNAADPDGDVLSFGWSSTLLDLDDLSGPEGTIHLPCDDDYPYTITVTVSDGEDEAIVKWTVQPNPPEPPENRHPVIDSRDPGLEITTISKDSQIPFTISASDPDGDTLTYVWGSSTLDMDDRDASSYIVDCPCDRKESYTVFVVVSDGEDEVRVEWTVDAEPKQESPDLQNNALSIAVIAVIVAVACTGALVYTFWNKKNGGGTDME